MKKFEKWFKKNWEGKPQDAITLGMIDKTYKCCSCGKEVNTMECYVAFNGDVYCRDCEGI